MEFDRKTDKISEDDFEILSRKLEDEALVIIEKIDQLEKKQKKGKPPVKQADAA